MKNIFLYIGIILVIACTVIARFIGIEAGLILELVGYSVALALCILSIVKKSEKKDWKLFVAILGIIIGVALLVFAGITEDKITAFVTAVIGILAMLAGFLPTVAVKKSLTAA